MSHGIGWAVDQVLDGCRVAREGWNGKGMWIALCDPFFMEAGSMTLPYVYVRAAQGGLIPWSCSQADLLATDWVLAEED